MVPRPSLHQSLHRSLLSVPTDKQVPRIFELTTLCTKPFRTYTLFPHALDPTIPIMRTDYLIMLAEKVDDPRLKETTPSDTRPKITVPVFALEASLYTISATSVQLLYISKIDTTGLAPLPAPAGQLTKAFLSHFLQYLPKSIHSLRIHIFARAAREGQYLFPCSAENAPNGSGDAQKFNPKLPSNGETTISVKKQTIGKRILDDQQLVRWWHKILSKVVIEYDQVVKLKNKLNCFYILPGFDHQESLEVFPVSSELRTLWNYGHPYHKIPNPFNPNLSNYHHDDFSSQDRQRTYLLSELIPAFNDDPKARFLHSIGNCSTNPSGEPGDWDDAIVERSPTSLENDRNRERTKINQISPDEFWDRMGGRQECCDGRVSGFFVISSSSKLDSSTSNNSSTFHQNQNHNGSSLSISAKNQGVNRRVSTTSNNDLKLTSSDEVYKPLVGVTRNVWVSLWSKIHNKDYSKFEHSSVGYSSWIEDVKSSIESSISQDRLRKKKIVVNNQKDDHEDHEEEEEEEEGKERIKEELSTTQQGMNKQIEVDDELSSLKFENCYSIIIVDNSLLSSNGSKLQDDSKNLDSSDPFYLNQQKRSQVNVLQPRKKPKKL